MPASAAREAWMLLGQVFMENRRTWVERFGELGLHPMQAFALRNLDPETPLAMGTLADLLRCDNSNITGIADRLETAGLVERRPHEGDRRVKALALTQKGVETREAVLEIMSDPPPPIAGLEPEDARALRDVMRRALSE